MTLLASVLDAISKARYANGFWRMAYWFFDWRHARSKFLATPFRTLEGHEAGGGHVIAGHVGQSLSDLENRLCLESQRRIASTFWDKSAAVVAINYVIIDRLSDIINWLNTGASSRERFDSILPIKTAIGFGIVRGRSGVHYFRSARIILERINPFEFIIITAHPI